ncbi:hypothetical protein JTE90_008168 [Oedothorax gibbosus]|uniref:DUF4773 domain-containing protein n=1 Tax=Oedothorax gibbosus TaxID=931172 RepID=A0AAV6VGD7_9ARAC|nr:hypothetical protein JTE90_008168 [Oedothorax gibbosus]
MTRLTLVAFSFVFALGFTVANAYPINKSLHPVDGCVCEKFSCGCCLYMDVPEIWLNNTACINFAYEPDVYGISFVVTLDDKALINETISARNPPPICFPVPYIEDLIDGCVHFTDLDISNSSFHGCVQLELRMWWVYVVAEVSLGCFDTLKLQKGLVGIQRLYPKGFERQKVVFSNLTVDDRYKYYVDPMKDVSPNENVTFSSVVNMEDNVNGIALHTADKGNSANALSVNAVFVLCLLIQILMTMKLA